MNDRYIDASGRPSLAEACTPLFAAAYLPPDRLQNAARINGPLLAVAASTFTQYVFEQATTGEFQALTSRLGWRAVPAGLVDPWQGAVHSFNQGTMREHLRLMQAGGQLQGAAEQRMLQNMSRRGALKGLFGAGLAIAANIAVDQYLFSHRRYGTATAIADGLIMPGLAIAPLPWHLRATLMAGSHFIGRCLDR